MSGEHTAVAHKVLHTMVNIFIRMEDISILCFNYSLKHY